MAKSVLSPVLKKLRGKVGNMVFRQLYGKTVVSSVPDFSRRKLSAAQKAHLQNAGSGSEAGEIFAEQPEAAGHLRRAGETGEEAAGFGGHPGLLPAEAGLTADYADFLHAGAKG